MKGRRTPYTVEGIKRVPCFRCGRKPSYASWQICANGRAHVPLCLPCDVSLQGVVLRWARDPDATAKVAAYRARVQEAAA